MNRKVIAEDMMRYLGSVIFLLLNMALMTPTQAVASADSQKFSPCVTDEQAREQVRRYEANLFEQSRRLNPHITLWHFARSVESIQWDWIRGEFVSENLGEFNCTPSALCDQRITIRCRREAETNGGLLHGPEIAVEPVR